jgi:hypothetical protein
VAAPAKGCWCAEAIKEMALKARCKSGDPRIKLCSATRQAKSIATVAIHGFLSQAF